MSWLLEMLGVMVDVTRLDEMEKNIREDLVINVALVIKYSKGIRIWNYGKGQIVWSAGKGRGLWQRIP